MAAPTPMVVDVSPGPYDILPVDLAALHTFDNTNGMTFPANGTTRLIFQNSTGGALTVTIDSKNDPKGRKGDITTYSIAAGHFAIFQEFGLNAWAGTVEASGALHYLCLQRAAGAVV